MRVLVTLSQPFTTSEARQALTTTRRVALPLLEHLDARGWTRPGLGNGDRDPDGHTQRQRTPQAHAGCRSAPGSPILLGG